MAARGFKGDIGKAVLIGGAIVAAYAIGSFNPPSRKAPLVLTAEGPKLDAPVATKPITVHVVGEVKKPGLYRLQTGDRVSDAIGKAGGVSPTGDAGMLNLAAPLRDGSQLRVPKIGEKVAVVESAPRRRPSPSATKPALTDQSISINSASPQELDRLPGVGPATAANIVAYREGNGGFQSIDDLMAVKGIGPKKLEKMRRYLKL
jgi:competence protein ComEA